MEGIQVAVERLDAEARSDYCTYVLDSDSSYTLRYLADIVRRVTDKDIVVNWGARPYREREVMKVWRQGTRLPGWQPKVPLEDGIRELWDLYV